MVEFIRIFTGAVRQKIGSSTALLTMALMVTAFAYGCGGGTDNAVPAGALSASESRIAFGTVAVGVESNKKVITITNNAKVDVTGISYGLEKGQTNIFLLGSSCVSTLAQGATCQVEVVVKPDQKNKQYSDVYAIKYKIEGNKDETLRLNITANTLNNAGIEVGNFDLLIAGADADSTEGNVTATFNNTAFGTLSDTKTLTLTYNGSSSVVLSVSNPMSNGAVSSSFRTVTDCLNLNSGDKCSIFAQFSPVDEGDFSADITITGLVDNKSYSDVVIKLIGKGIAPSGDNVLADIVVSDNATASVTETLFGPVQLGDYKEKVLKLTNNTTTPLLYRLSSTVSSISLLYGTGANDCNGKLDAGKSCTFYSYYSPSTAGDETGYIRVIRGSRSKFIKAKGTGNANEGLTYGSLTLSAKSLSFPRTEVGFESEVRTVTIKNTGTTQSGRIRISIPDAKAPFSYTTTCVDDAVLPIDGSCAINIFFSPLQAEASSAYKLNVTQSGQTNPYEIELKGVAIPAIPNDNSTDISNITVSTKRINFPNTPVGFYSSAIVFRVSNTGTEPVNGFTHTSTDLIRFSPEVQLTTCSNTIAAGATCDVAYKFRATQAITFKEYIKIAADSASGKADLAGASEIIELTGRGVLTNKNIFFGFVSKETKTKDITYGIVNETASRREISKIEIEAVRWNWKARTNNPISGKPAAQTESDFMTEKWFPRCGTFKNRVPCTGDNVDFTNYFSRDPVTPNPFTLVSDGCSKQSIDAGGSCSIKLRYDATLNTTGEPLSVYINVYNGENMVVDTLHGIASSVDDTTYFFPPEGNEKPAVLNEFSSFGYNDSIFTIGGTHYKEPAVNDGDGFFGYYRDRYARKYDTARNIWTKYDNYEGRDWVAVQYGNNDNFVAGQERSILYNGKVYVYGSQRVTEFDPAPTGTKVGAWREVGGTIGVRRSLTATAAYNNVLYLFGGRNGLEMADNKLARDIWKLDLTTGRWELIARENNLDLLTDTFPEARDLAAMDFIDNKLFVYSGVGFDSRFLTTTSPRFTVDGMYVFEAPKVNSDGAIINEGTMNKWTKWFANTVNWENPAEDNATDMKRPYPKNSVIAGTIANRYLFIRSGGQTQRYFTLDSLSNGELGGKPRWNGWSMVPNVGTTLPSRTKNMVVDNVLWIYTVNVMGVQISSGIADLLTQK